MPLRSFRLLAKQYGEIYQLDLLSNNNISTALLVTCLTHLISDGKVIVISSQRLLAEVSDERRFVKKPFTHLKQVRNALGDALFTVRVHNTL